MRKLLALSAVALSCGGSDDLPICPTDDCTPPTVTVVRWTLDAYPELLFPGDTCNDLGVVTMRVDIVGVTDPAIVDTKDVACNQGQASFLDLPEGEYTVTLTALDAGGNLLVNAPTSAMAMAGTADDDSTVTINIGFETWTSSFTGTFLFRLSWAGASCEAAVPAVATQTLTLKVGAGSTATTVLADNGQKLDGTDPKPCRPLSESFAQFAEGLPAGPATLIVTGKTTAGDVAFENTFDTFVGAAKNNPTITFDVPEPPPPDAGVDAMPDSM